MLQNHVFSFEFLSQLLKQQQLFLMELKYFFAKWTPTFINGPANLLSNEPKKSSRLNYFRYLSSRQLHISWHILFSNAFLNFVFCLIVNNNSPDKLFPLDILIHFDIQVTPVWFLTVLNHLYIVQKFCKKKFLFLSKILGLFLLIFQE